MAAKAGEFILNFSPNSLQAKMLPWPGIALATTAACILYKYKQVLIGDRFFALR
jgi:hypothetical protein